MDANYFNPKYLAVTFRRAVMLIKHSDIRTTSI